MCARCAARADVRTPFGIVCRRHTREPVAGAFLQQCRLGCSLSSLMMLPCLRASRATSKMLPQRGCYALTQTQFGIVGCCGGDIYRITAVALWPPRCDASESVVAVVVTSTASLREALAAWLSICMVHRLLHAVVYDFQTQFGSLATGTRE